MYHGQGMYKEKKSFLNNFKSYRTDLFFSGCSCAWTIFMQKGGKCWWQSGGITLPLRHSRLYVCQSLLPFFWADFKLMIYELEIHHNPSRISARKTSAMWCLKTEKEPQFVAVFFPEWSCWCLAKASRFRVGSPWLPPSPRDAGFSQGQFPPTQRSESTWGDSSSPVPFTSANMALKATENRSVVRWGCICLWFTWRPLQSLQGGQGLCPCWSQFNVGWWSRESRLVWSWCAGNT